MADKWEIEWERNQDHDGEKRAVSIGPIQASHDHWSGWTIADALEAYKASAAPEMYEALKEWQKLESEIDECNYCYRAPLQDRYCGGHFQARISLRKMRDAALLKAEGREVEDASEENTPTFCTCGKPRGLHTNTCPIGRLVM